MFKVQETMLTEGGRETEIISEWDCDIYNVEDKLYDELIPEWVKDENYYMEILDEFLDGCIMNRSLIRDDIEYYCNIIKNYEGVE